MLVLNDWPSKRLNCVLRKMQATANVFHDITNNAAVGHIALVNWIGSETLAEDPRSVKQYISTQIKLLTGCLIVKNMRFLHLFGKCLEILKDHS